MCVHSPSYALKSISWPGEWSAALEQISSVRYAPITTVALGFRQSQIAHALDGFGVLFPSIGKHRILGTLFNSSMFAGRAPDGSCLLTTFVGGVRANQAPSPADATTLALAELGPLLGLQGAPVMTSVSSWDAGIPQFEIGHEKVLAAAASIEASSTQGFFTGSHLSGVAIGDCLSHGLDVGARAAATGLRSRSESRNILAQAF